MSRSLKTQPIRPNSISSWLGISADGERGTGDRLDERLAVRGRFGNDGAAGRMQALPIGQWLAARAAGPEIASR